MYYEKISTEGMVEVIYVLTKVLTVLGTTGICFALSLIIKLGFTWIVCKHPELSDDKVKYLTQIFSSTHFKFK